MSKEQQEEKLFVCPKAKEGRCDSENCEHFKPHTEYNKCSIKEGSTIKNGFYWFCPVCIPIEPEPKGYGEELNCKHENDCCKYPSCLENDCTGFEPKKPEGEQVKCKYQIEEENMLEGKRCKKDMLPCQYETEEQECPEHKGTGLKPSEKGEGVEEIMKQLINDIVGMTVDWKNSSNPNRNMVLDDNCKFWGSKRLSQLRQAIEREIIKDFAGDYKKSELNNHFMTLKQIIDRIEIKQKLKGEIK